MPSDGSCHCVVQRTIRASEGFERASPTHRHPLAVEWVPSNRWPSCRELVSRNVKSRCLDQARGQLPRDVSRRLAAHISSRGLHLADRTQAAANRKSVISERERISNGREPWENLSSETELK